MKSFEQEMKEIELIFREEADSEENKDMKEVLKATADAVMRYLPARVVNLHTFNGYEQGKCPSCNKIVTRYPYTGVYPVFYCYVCGQALKWN